MIVARFQRWGIMLVLKAMLYMFVRYLMASGPRCLMVMPSGPVQLFVLFEMANCICVVVSCISLVERVLSMHSYTRRLILFGLYGVTFVNCLLEAVALYISVIAVLVLKQMFLLCRLFFVE